MSLLVAAMLPAAGETAAETQRTVKVSFYDYAGCHNRAADGKLSGYGYDVCERLAKVTGWKFEYVGFDHPWGDMLPMLEKGELDLVDFVGYVRERGERFLYGRYPIAYSGCSIRTTAEKLPRFPIGEFHRWGRIRVGAMAGDQNIEEFERFAAERALDYELIEFHDEFQAAEELKKGKLDFVAVDGFSPLKGFVSVNEYHPVGNYLLARRGDRELMDAVNAAMERLNREDPQWLLNIRAKHYPLRDLICYLPDSEDWSDDFRRYLWELMNRLSEIGGYRPLFRECKKDFSDAVGAAPGLLCGITAREARRLGIEVPFLPCGRKTDRGVTRPFYLAANNGDEFLNRELVGAIRTLRFDQPEKIIGLERRYLRRDAGNRRHVRVGIATDIGIASRDEDGNAVGFNVAVFKAIARKCDWDVVMLPLTYLETRNALASGAIDAAGTMLKTAANADKIGFSDFSIGPIPYRLMTTPGSRLVPDRPDTWGHSTIGFVNGSIGVRNLNHLLTLHRVSADMRPFADYHLAEAALRKGEVDAVLGVSNDGNRDLLSLAEVPTDDCYIGLNQGKPEVKSDIDRAIAEILREDPEFFSKLRTRYLEPPAKTPESAASESGSLQSNPGGFSGAVKWAVLALVLLAFLSFFFNRH